MDTLGTATVLTALVLLAAMASVELGVSVAILQITVGSSPASSSLRVEREGDEAEKTDRRVRTASAG